MLFAFLTSSFGNMNVSSFVVIVTFLAIFFYKFMTVNEYIIFKFCVPFKRIKNTHTITRLVPLPTEGTYDPIWTILLVLENILQKENLSTAK